MAELKCKAESCTYNKNEYCCKGDIMVGGKHACDCDDTCCESFSERRADSFSSALNHPSPTISVDCEVSKCTYNNNYKCLAEHVDIMGSGASNRKETACATFKDKF